VSSGEHTLDHGPSRQCRRRVLCLGNEFLGDDALGYVVAEQLRCLLSSGIGVVSTSEGGLHLLDHVLGVDLLVVVDTIETNQAPPGTIHEFHDGELSRFPGSSLHTVGLFETLELAARLNCASPTVTVFAVEARNSLVFGNPISSELRASIPAIVKMVQQAAGDVVQPQH